MKSKHCGLMQHRIAPSFMLHQIMGHLVKILRVIFVMIGLFNGVSVKVFEATWRSCPS